MEPYVRCVCDQNVTQRLYQCFPHRKSIRCSPENSRGKLSKPLQFVAPQRFVTSSLVQALSYIDNLLPGMEVEIHTTTSAEAVALRPMN